MDLTYTPYSQEAEQAVLGSVFLESTALNTLVEKLTIDDFYEQRNKYLYDVLKDMYTDSTPVDVTTVSNYLKKAETLDKIGGIAYVVELVDRVYAVANVDAYIEIVQKYSLLRQLVGMAHMILEHGRNENKDANELLEEVERQILKIGTLQQTTEFHQIRDVVGGALEYIEQLKQNEKGVTGLTTGYKDLDEMTAGLKGSELIIVGARPAMGKTAFALNISRNAALENDAVVMIFSLEMSAQQLVMRLLASEAKIPFDKLRTGKLTSEEFNRLTIGANNLAKMKIIIDDSPGITVGEMRSKCRRVKETHNLDMVMIDYLQLIHSNVRAASRQEEVSYISRNLKGLARELDVPVIALSQLSRAVESRPDKKPMMSDIRESGSIEQDADVVAFLYREDYYNPEAENPNTVEIIIGKQRSGPVGTVTLSFIKEYSKFENFSNRDEYSV